MRNPFIYFNSLTGFFNLLKGLKRRFLECYYRLFLNHIKYNLQNKIKKSFIVENQKDKIKALIKLTSNIKEILSEKEVSAILQEADAISNGYINILSSGKTKLDPINWHVDFKTGYSWPKGHFFRDYDQELLSENCDVKVPRELSRSHHLLKIAVAYYLTKEEKYAAYCINNIDSWIEENPLMFSINWGCTMDVSIRSVNWIWIIRLIIDSKSITDEFIKKTTLSLYEHGWYIYRNPENGIDYNHNHYLSDLAGQIYLGLLFNDLEEPKKWLEEAKHEFFREMRLQVLPSGMTYERSTNYNRLVLELFLWPILLLKNNGHEIPYDIWYRLETMFDFIMQSLKPDGKSPVIGDQDNGRLLAFGPEEGLDFRYLLSISAVLFNRSDFKSKSNGFNFYSAFSGVNKPYEVFNNIHAENIELGSKFFKDIGIAIMRNKEDFLLFNASGMAKYPEICPGSHTHSDLLSFELFTLGKTFLVDPGTYVYTADLQQRLLFRSTKMHNTVIVDGFSQNNLFLNKPWYFERNAIPKIIDWQSNEESDVITASHDGYSRLKEPIIHIRTIKYDKLIKKWEIEDELTGTGTHLFEWFFHFDVNIDFKIEGLIERYFCSIEWKGPHK